MIPMVGANVWTCFAKAEWRPDGAAQGTGFEVLSANIAQSAQCDARRAGGCDRRWQPRHIVGDGCPRAVPQGRVAGGIEAARRSEEHTSELQSLMRISYAVFCLKKKRTHI